MAQALLLSPAVASPAVVNVGVRIDNLAEVDELHERWEVSGVLVTSWTQSNLKYHAPNRYDDHRDISDAVARIPNITFANATDTPNFRQTDLFVRPDGTVFKTENFHALLSTHLDLRRFPFDTQNLPLVVLPEDMM